jgi:hypothetical protein
MKEWDLVNLTICLASETVFKENRGVWDQELTKNYIFSFSLVSCPLQREMGGVGKICTIG